ncbi:hypothetical protein [Bifidobacterium simiiventris]|uniref:hypothetical protein n=1 Tax=Bifidobacterium simiiventris TaxID=2834434 RepID=UPI001C59CE3D|nr:hypothetical protein [Bifidobacterium simiiventris]MBW3078232.1 hypothetical protein [Bifidobacterium simiiventris]
MKNTLRFENEYDPDRPLLCDRYTPGYVTFQIGAEALTAHPVTLSPSQVQELVAWLTEGGNRG